MAMVVASRLLPHGPNRAAQLFAGAFKMACASFIVALTWRWRESVKSPHTC